MTAHCERLTLRFGVKANGTGLFAGFPNVTADRAGMIIPSIATSWDTLAGAAQPLVGVDFAQVSAQVKLPPRSRGDGPVTAIAIAPDSPLDAVNMVIVSRSDQNVHRIGVGAPFVGVITEAEDVFFVPITMPLLSRPPAVAAAIQANNPSLTTAFWDVTYETGNAPQLLVPVRLNVYRGVYPGALQRRARYDAPVSFDVVDLGGGVASQPCVIVLTPGRRRVHISASLQSGKPGFAGSLRVDAGDPYKTAGNTGGGQDGLDTMAWNNLFPDTPLTQAADITPTTFDYAGNPFHAFAVTITGGAIGTRGYIHVNAYDD